MNTKEQEKETLKWKHQVKKSVLGEVNFMNSELLWLMAIIYKHNNEVRHLEEQVENIVFICPNAIVADIVRTVKISPKQQQNLMKDLNVMYQRGLFTVVETKRTKIPKKLRWNETVAIDVTNIIRMQNEKVPFIGFEDDDLLMMTSCDFKLSQIPTLLAVYVNIISYFNMNDIIAIDNGEFDLSYENTKEARPHIDCWASINKLCTTRFSRDEKVEQWISKDTLQKYIKLLTEVGLLSVVKPNPKLTKGENFSNHYCFPRHAKLVQQLADRDAYQRVYARGCKPQEEHVC